MQLSKLLLLVGLLFTVYSNAAQPSVQKQILGSWAMVPLQNGIANVVEFKTNGEVVNHSFKCDFIAKKVRTGEAEVSTYSIKGDTISLTLKGADKPFSTLTFKGVEQVELEVVGKKALTLFSLTLVQSFTDNEKLEFHYYQVDPNNIKPLCSLFWE